MRFDLLADNAKASCCYFRWSRRWTGETAEHNVSFSVIICGMCWSHCRMRFMSSATVMQNCQVRFTFTMGLMATVENIIETTQHHALQISCMVLRRPRRPGGQGIPPLGAPDYGSDLWSGDWNHRRKLSLTGHQCQVWCLILAVLNLMKPVSKYCHIIDGDATRCWPARCVNGGT